MSRGTGVIRVEDDALIVDGRLKPDDPKGQLGKNYSNLNQLLKSGYVNVTLEPNSGIVSGFNPTTQEIIVAIPTENGELGTTD